MQQQQQTKAYTQITPSPPKKSRQKSRNFQVLAWNNHIHF